MRGPVGTCLTIAVVAMFAACASSGAQQACRGPRRVDELQQLTVVADSTAGALRQSADTMSPTLRQYLRGVVDRVVALERCGRVTTPAELRQAAMVAYAARTLGERTVERAYGWSRLAVVRDSADRRNWRVMALSWDQLQVLQHKPQWFATVVSCVTPILGRCTLAPLDTTRVSEAQRVEIGLPTLLEQRLLVDSLNRIRSSP
ncbi:MAG: hypothetical protein V4813_05050 [Gemmatimonadota bacterium]